MPFHFSISVNRLQFSTDEERSALAPQTFARAWPSYEEKYVGNATADGSLSRHPDCAWSGDYKICSIELLRAFDDNAPSICVTALVSHKRSLWQQTAPRTTHAD